MKKSAYQIIYSILLALTNRLNNKMLIRYKLAIGSALLLLNNGNAFAQQDKSSENTTSIEQDTITAKEDSSQIFCYVREKMPEFPGGQGVMLRYMAEQVKSYTPSPTWKNGRVTLSFVIDTIGHTGQVVIINSLTPEQDSIAKRIIIGMPKWSPGGGANGELVEVKYTVPVTFRDIKITE